MEPVSSYNKMVIEEECGAERAHLFMFCSKLKPYT